MLKNPEIMTPEEIVREIESLQEEVSIKGRRAYDLSRSLYRRARKDTTNDNVTVYVTYANSITRFAGAIEQLVNRTLRSGRILQRIPKSVDLPAEKKAKVVSLRSSSPMINYYIERPNVRPPSSESEENESD